ncbi:MAG TPA: hypothetical protein VLH79_01000 [Chthonomonadales bacterium]|nr:hypothetical protein [Chthonomonadales bacterium]
MMIAALALLAPSPPPIYADYAGRPFVTQRAPVLRFQRRRAPLPYGIDYPFPEQTARGVALLRRFPPFSLSDRRIFVGGPWYSTPEANLHFSRGITAIDAFPNFRLDGSLTDVRDLPRERKLQMVYDPLAWETANRLANELEAADPRDERIAPLRTFGTEHRFTPHEAAFRALGRRLWELERHPTDRRGQGVAYVCLNIEYTGGWEHQRACFGWIYQGMAKAAAAHGLRIVPIIYGQWTFCVGLVHQSVRDPRTGLPEYLLPERDYLAAPDPTLEAVQAHDGVVSMDGYLRAIWGREPFYQRDANGALLLRDGRPVPSEISATTAYGQRIPLEPGEAERCLQDLYRQAGRLLELHFRLAGGYAESSAVRKPFLSRARVGAWTRITNEGLEGIQANDRPLPPWLLETLMLLYLFTADDIVVWSSDFNHPPQPLGADNSRTWRYNAHGVLEHVVKAAHRYSALDPIRRGAFRWCWFRLPMVDRNEVEGERYVEKPLAIAKLRTYRGRPWIEMFAAWPALDDQAATLHLWVERGGRRSPTYAIRLRDGRTSFLDAWELPAAFDGAGAADVRLRFTDLLGRERTWSGDWRDPAVVRPGRQK